MLKDVVEVKVLNDYRLSLRFEDGVEGAVDVAKLVHFSGVFEALQDREQFAQVRVNQELGTICWPNGADLDPDVLHASITGESILQGETALAALRR